MSRTFLPHVITDDSALGGMKIERSLRFNYSDTANLTRTSSSTSTTFTYSAWIKRSAVLGTYRYIFSMGNRGFAFHVSNHTFYLYDGSNLNEATPQFRDQCGWYHVVVQINSGVATSYINGVLVHNAVGSGFTLTTGSNETRIGMHQPGYYYWHGYMAEINLVDGSVVAPTEFGFTDSQTGIWMPKRYEGTYGTNGFYLDFSDNSSTAALGIDKSPNGNDFTVNNFSVSSGVGDDSSLDTPTNNLPTLNPLNSDPYSSSSYTPATFTNGNLQYTTNTTSLNNYAESSIYFPRSGKWYLEITLANVNIGSGVGYAQIDVAGYYLWWHYNSPYYEINTVSGKQTIGSLSNNDIIQVAYDVDSGYIWYGKNNSWYLSGDPSSGTPMSPAAQSSNSDASNRLFLNGRTGSAQNIMHVNFGQRPFNYTPPTGFKALCTANLRGDSSYIIEPQKHFDILTYTGNDASDRTITGLEFKPDLVWIKNRSQGDWHIFTDSVRGANTHMYPNNTDGDSTDNSNGHVNYYTTGGFNVDCGAQGNVNENNEDYVAWCWKGGGNSNTYNIDGTGYGTASAAGLDGGTITPTGASINTKARFSIIGYTGNGSGGSTVEHGLGVVPTFMIIKKRTGDNWMTYHQGANNFSSPQNYYFELNSNSGDIGSTSIFMWTVAPTSSVFSLGADSSVNKNNNTYISYCWGEVPGYSKFGMFGGTGVSGTNGAYIHTGFRPSFVIIKKFSGSDAWEMVDTARSTYNNKTASLYPSSETTETTSGRVIDFYSDGFKQQNGNGNTNEDGHQYVYFAWAEQVGETPYGTFTNAR